MIKIGEYVRTKYGISKVIKNVDEYVTEEQICVDFLGCMYNQVISKRQVKKHSKQLIDLIEKDDYVNGYKVIDTFIDTDDIGNDFKTIQIETFNVIYKSVKTEEIKTILTKEQMMSNCYKVGGEDGN